MKVKRILSFLLVVVIAVSLVGCTSNEYCSSPSEAYENNKTQNSAIYIKRGITKAQVSDDVIIWIAHNNKTDIVLAPMMVKDNKYYFAELTFTPCACMMPFNPKEKDFEWGELLNIENLIKRRGKN